MAKIALITGGNGITGSAIIEYLVKNTTASEWSKIIVTSRSPFKTTVHDDRITFIALDLSNDPNDLIEKMRPVCGGVTHAYFSSYVHKDDFKELNIANEKLFSNFLDALIAVAPELENCVLQTGGKHYNVHLGPVPSPAREEDPRKESPIGNFYYVQEDYLIKRSTGQKWTWNVIRPEAIIGHTPKPNGMNSALTYALYFLVCKELGEEARMPTNQLYWEGYDDLSDSRLIANLTIWASTSQKAGNQAFNVTNGDYFTWRYMWPRIAKYMGASATDKQVFTKSRPKEGETQLDVSLAEWAADKQEVWDRICNKHSCPEAKATWESAIYTVPRSTLGDRRAGRPSRGDTMPPLRSLDNNEEELIVEHILHHIKRGFPPRLADVADIANSLRQERGLGPVGRNWPSTFVKRQLRLQVKSNRK
ncbi:nucleoside-diphosphate-sugar epimerase [Stemphylium lycopersici]|uniref:Nucleoside-diphosphate-sugar epimerase n=1 Tax=Stemphylium lycopersici TaxID=183478 RepID=A0A364MRF0_STELY|nr:nucleoside-diphosphate-sugar epimerase [Stemphylium lycopersici]RAQ98633.1 nucleoside-diphosphate-sugar epimerase [Stemphylium lycopersici]RAR00618.1 nucleoside-diphosphate-sugar epimerase [Stemphylium lycopersici]